MQEFIYYDDKKLDFPLSDKILVSNNLSTIESYDYLVSNTKSIDAEVIANEIGFYIKNSKDSDSAKIKNVEKLYELNALRFDLAKDITYSQEVQNKVLLVCNDEEKKDFLNNSILEEFDLFHIDESIIKNITGHIGNLIVTVDDEHKDVDIFVDQIVWFDAKLMGLKQSGTLDPNDTSLEDVINTLRANIKQYEYKKYTIYDKNICQYHERREVICSKCEEVCPTVAISKDDTSKTLAFSQINCTGCGACISVCPSGALEYTPSNKEAIYEMSKFLNGHIALIVPNKMQIDNLDIQIKENILPFAIDGEQFLDECDLLTIVQESGAQSILYTDLLSQGTKDAISILNQIYQKKYGLDAILLAMNEEELRQAIKKVSFIPNSRFTFNESNSRKREIFAIRLSNIVQNDNLGEVTTGEYVHYGLVKVNESTCTLCLVCVGACNVNALQADASDNTLRLNPSLCTSCGYCEVSCPESDCLTIQRDVIKLEPMWFKENILAKDTLFACLECGEEFATTKAIDKIASIMLPLFKGDKIKEKSLYCCANCKPKIMMQNYFDEKNKGILNAR